MIDWSSRFSKFYPVVEDDIKMRILSCISSMKSNLEHKRFMAADINYVELGKYIKMLEDFNKKGENNE